MAWSHAHLFRPFGSRHLHGGSRSSSIPPEDVNSTGRSGATHVVRQSDVGIPDLTVRFDLASELLDDLDDLSCSGCAEWMPLRLQATTRIHGR